MLDFTSALYLGMRHPTSALAPWAQLTTGRPAALGLPHAAERVARGLADLTGCERATLCTSTLHLYWDLFDVLNTMAPIAIYLDEGSYPIARWGVERMAALGVPVHPFRQHDAAMLQHLLRTRHARRRRPVVVADGLCPATGRPAPLPDYVELVRRCGGYVVVDDTQALGILGHDPSHAMPYGQGGGGTAAWHGIDAPELILGSSMAKGFGVPMAMLAGQRKVVDRFDALATTRVHCSPPSAPLVAAAEHALILNRRYGESLRHRLLSAVMYFRRRLAEVGLSTSGGWFPVQTPNLGSRADICHHTLTRQGVSTVLHSARAGLTGQLSFLISSGHLPSVINHTVNLLKRADCNPDISYRPTRV